MDWNRVEVVFIEDLDDYEAIGLRDPPTEPFDDIDESPAAFWKWLSYSGANPLKRHAPRPKSYLTSTNREALIVSTQAIRAIKKGCHSDLTLDEWRAIVKAHSGRCVYCDGKYSCMDHVVPLSRGGAHTAQNVVPACQGCNSSKHARELTDWAMSRGMDVGALLQRIDFLYLQATTEVRDAS